MDRSRPSPRAGLPGPVAAVARAGAAIAVALAAVLGGTVAASAHVTLAPSTTAAGATAVVRLVVPHGCEGSATTEVAVRMPEAVTEVAAESTDRWRVEQADGRLTFRTDAPAAGRLRGQGRVLRPAARRGRRQARLPRRPAVRGGGGRLDRGGCRRGQPRGAGDAGAGHRGDGRRRVGAA